ncbi:MAG TPA: serine/threonine-protein kinase, partial [Aggregatilineaceae bacterium]|nr:serine/threonine-protein kinase [Aggregatilineaceae bacterium]
MNIHTLSGTRLGQYQLYELIGVGGMAAVYRAYHPALNRFVAIKVLSPSLAQDPQYIERFDREARIAGTLEHRYIVPIYDYGVQDGISYVVMRLLTGGTLAQRTRQSALPLDQVMTLLDQLAGALDFAHSRGIIHRDIKPSNIMFDDEGNAYITDLGIAKLMEGTTSFTSTGQVMGTPLYMAPEQWRAEPLTPAADQYALAVMVYGLVAGHPPFEAPTPHALMYFHLNQMPPRVDRPGVPDAVSQVLARALAKRPQDRFPTVTQFAQAFAAA